MVQKQNYKSPEISIVEISEIRHSLLSMAVRLIVISRV